MRVRHMRKLLQFKGRRWQLMMETAFALALSQSPAPATAAPCSQLEGVLSLLELNQWDADLSGGNRFFNQLNYNRSAQHSLLHMALEYPAVHELANNLGLLEGSGVADGSRLGVLTELNAWAQRHAIPFEFVTRQQIAALLAAAPHPSVQSARNSTFELTGYLDHVVWNYLISIGKFPLLDAHDLLTHVPQLVLPGMADALRVRSQLQLKLAAEFPELASASSLNRALIVLESDASPPDAMARAYAAYIGQAVVRSYTYETMVSVVHDAESNPKIVMLGNAALGFTARIEDYPARALAEALLPSNNTEFIDHPLFRSYAARKTPVFSEFLRLARMTGATAAENARLKGRLEKVIADALSSPQEGDGSSRFGRMVKWLFRIKGSEASKPIPRVLDASDPVADFYERFAAGLETDPQLKAALSPETRIAFLQSSQRMLEEYLQFSTP